MADDIQHVRQGSEQWAEIRAEFVDAQAGRCAICSETLSDPQLDHCHSTGFIRGALCTACNTKLGWYEAHRRGIETYLARAAEHIAHRTTDRMHRNERLRHYWQSKVLS